MVSRYEWTESSATSYAQGMAELQPGEELVISANPSHFFQAPKDQKDFTKMMEVRGAKVYTIRRLAPERRQKATGAGLQRDRRERSGPRG